MRGGGGGGGVGGWGLREQPEYVNAAKNESIVCIKRMGERDVFHSQVILHHNSAREAFSHFSNARKGIQSDSLPYR